jgi:hypothetical protein
MLMGFSTVYNSVSGTRRIQYLNILAYHILCSKVSLALGAFVAIQRDWSFGFARNKWPSKAGSKLTSIHFHPNPVPLPPAAIN